MRVRARALRRRQSQTGDLILQRSWPCQKRGTVAGKSAAWKAQVSGLNRARPSAASESRDQIQMPRATAHTTTSAAPASRSTRATPLVVAPVVNTSSRTMSRWF